MSNKLNQQEFEKLVKQLIIQELKSGSIKENLDNSEEFGPLEFDPQGMEDASQLETDPVKDQELLNKVLGNLNILGKDYAKKKHEKKFGTGSINETGEWSDDEEGQAWIAGLQNELEWVQNMLNPGIPFIVNNIKGFDKYQGPYANVHIAGDNYKIWTTEENMLWIENFPIDNTSKHGQRPGFEGDARQLAAAINTQYSVLSPIHMNESWEDFDEGPQPGDVEYHNPKPNIQKGIGKFNNIDWQILHETLMANTEYYGSGKVEGNPNYIEAGVNDLTDAHEGMLTNEEFSLLEDYDLVTVVKHYPIIGDEKYADYNTFYEAAKAAWEKGPVVHNTDNSSETPYLRGREDLGDIIGEHSGGFTEEDVADRHFDMKSLYHYFNDALHQLKWHEPEIAAQILEATIKRDFKYMKNLFMNENIQEGHVNPDTKINRPKDAEGNPLTLKARVETLDGSAAGRIIRFGVDESGKMTAHVSWIGNFGGNVPKTIIPIDQIVVRDSTRIVREDVDGEYMYKQNLNLIKDAAEALINKVNDDNMEDWAEDKISKCAENMRAVRDYYNHGEGEIEEGMGQSLTVGKGQNLKPSNYPENRERQGLNENLDMAQQESDEVFLVVNSGFNKAHYPDLIGKTFADAPSFAQVKLIKPEDLEKEKSIDYDDAGKPEQVKQEDFDYAAAEREYHGQEELKGLDSESKNYIAEELQKFYVPNTFNLTQANPETGSFEYSYELRIPKQSDEATRDVEKFVKEEEGEYYGGPGQTYQKVNAHVVLEKMSTTWVVNVTVTRGYDV